MGKKDPAVEESSPAVEGFFHGIYFWCAAAAIFLKTRTGCLRALAVHWGVLGWLPQPTDGSRLPGLRLMPAAAVCRHARTAGTFIARPLQRRSLFYLPLQHLFHPSLSFSKPHAPRLRRPALVYPRTQPLPASTGEGKRARLVGRCARTTRFENHTVKSSVDAPSMSGGLWCFMTNQ